MDETRVRVTRDARKHKLTRTRILFALNNDAEYTGSEGDREFYTGIDNYGVELEMILVPDDRDPSRMACIQAMPSHYRNDEEDD